MPQYVWITQRATCNAYWLKWQNGETVGYFNYWDPAPPSPWTTWEDIFIYKKEIYIADYFRGIYVFNMEKEYQRHWHPERPNVIWINNNEVYVARNAVNDEGVIRVYDLQGNLKREWEINTGWGTVQNALGVSVGSNNLVYASLDYFFPTTMESRLKIYTKLGNPIKEIVFPNGSGRPLAHHHAHYKNELYVTDFNQCLVKVFDLDLNFIRQFGPGWHIGSSSPTGIAVTSNKVLAKVSYPEAPLTRFTTQGVIDPTFVSDVMHPGGVFVPTKGVQYLPVMGMG